MTTSRTVRHVRGALAIQLTGVTHTIRGERVMDTPVEISYPSTT